MTHPAVQKRTKQEQNAGQIAARKTAKRMKQVGKIEHAFPAETIYTAMPVVDPNVKLPWQVRAAAANSNSYYSDTTWATYRKLKAHMAACQLLMDELMERLAKEFTK